MAKQDAWQVLVVNGKNHVQKLFERTYYTPMEHDAAVRELRRDYRGDTVWHRQIRIEEIRHWSIVR